MRRKLRSSFFLSIFAAHEKRYCFPCRASRRLPPARVDGGVRRSALPSRSVGHGRHQSHDMHQKPCHRGWAIAPVGRRDDAPVGARERSARRHARCGWRTGSGAGWRRCGQGGGRSGHAHRPARQYGAFRAVSVERRFFHTMRSRGFPPHHPFPGSPGCDGALHGDTGGAARAVPGAALQRQSDRGGAIGGRLALRALGRPVPQAILPVRAGGGEARAAGAQGQDPLQAQGAAASVGGGRQPRSRRARARFLGRRDALG